jgi:hypothetical protein
MQQNNAPDLDKSWNNLRQDRKCSMRGEELRDITLTATRLAKNQTLTKKWVVRVGVSSGCPSSIVLVLNREYFFYLFFSDSKRSVMQANPCLATVFPKLDFHLRPRCGSLDGRFPACNALHEVPLSWFSLKWRSDVLR